MSDETFPAFQKVPRRRRNITITEKIDGTNGLVSVTPSDGSTFDDVYVRSVGWFLVRAGSKNRWLGISKQTDDHGFAKWVFENRETLVDDLGPGNHYGEWWGNGIQRGYGLAQGDKRFSLFNTKRWNYGDERWTGFATPQLGVVEVLTDDGPNTDEVIDEALARLREHGSFSAHLYPKPEGIVIFEHASNRLSKITLEKDEEWKGKKTYDGDGVGFIIEDGSVA